MNSRQIAQLIASSRKTTPAKVYVSGEFRRDDFAGAGFQAFGEGSCWVLIGDYGAIESWLRRRRRKVTDS